MYQTKLYNTLVDLKKAIIQFSRWKNERELSTGG